MQTYVESDLINKILVAIGLGKSKEKFKGNLTEFESAFWGQVEKEIEEIRAAGMIPMIPTETPSPTPLIN